VEIVLDACRKDHAFLSCVGLEMPLTRRELHPVAAAASASNMNV
jgi:hypothetical protein